jgi:hypothetical protein
MLMLEHFRPPLSVTHPWKGFQSTCANVIEATFGAQSPVEPAARATLAQEDSAHCQGVFEAALHSCFPRCLPLRL